MSTNQEQLVQDMGSNDNKKPAKLKVDLSKLKYQMEKAGINETKLSLKLNKSHGWLYSIRKNAEKQEHPNTCELRLNLVQKMAAELNCTIQDLGGPQFSPIIIDEKAKLEDTMKKILNDADLSDGDYEFICSFLMSVKDLSEENKSAIKAIAEKRPKSNPNMTFYVEKWWVGKLFTELYCALLMSEMNSKNDTSGYQSKFHIKTENELRTAYEKQKREIGKTRKGRIKLQSQSLTMPKKL